MHLSRKFYEVLKSISRNSLDGWTQFLKKLMKSIRHSFEENFTQLKKIPRNFQKNACNFKDRFM